MGAIHRIICSDGSFASALRQNVIRVIGSYGREQEIGYDCISGRDDNRTGKCGSCL